MNIDPAIIGPYRICFSPINIANIPAGKVLNSLA